MFEQKEPISYCKMKDGKIVVYKGKDKSGERKEEFYDQIVAKITDIRLRENEYQGEIIKAWQLFLLDDSGAKAVLSLGYSSGFTRSFLNALLTADLAKPIIMRCYVKVTDRGEYNAPSLSQNGEYLRLKYEEMPKTEKVKVGSKDVINDEEAIKWTIKIVDEIKDMIPAKVEEVFKEEMIEEDSLPSDLPF